VRAARVFVSARLQLQTSKLRMTNLYTHANVAHLCTHTCTRRFITGGTNAGIMKSVGEARAKYNPSVPLIGVTSLPGIAGGLQLRKMNTPDVKNEKVEPADLALEHFPTLKEIKEYTSRGGNPDNLSVMIKLPTYKHKGQTFQQDLSGAWIECSIECSPEQEKDFRGNTKSRKGSEMSYDDLVQMEAEAESNRKDKPHLDPNHSHFILVDKDEWNTTKDGFGADRHFRAAFESAVAGADVQEELSKVLHGMDVRGGRGKASRNIADHRAPPPAPPIPHVLVCVQGGSFTVDTVLQACQHCTSGQSCTGTSGQSGTPVLLVCGSGKAADLLSDAVRLQFTPSHPAHVSWLNFDTRQDEFWKFLELCDVNPRDYEGKKLYDWGEAIKNIQNAIKNSPAHEELLKNAQKLVRETYNILASDNIFASEEKKGSKEDSEECLTMIKKSLEVALTKKGWVFDLQSTEPGTDDFNLALLKCLLNGIASVGEESADKLREKLKLSMIWSSEDSIDYLLERISKRIKVEEQQDIFTHILLIALQEHRVHALKALIHRGTGMQMLDVGNGFCSVSNAAAEKEANFMDRDRKRYFDAASQWTELIEVAKTRNPYFVVMWDNYMSKAEKNLRSASTQEDHELEKIMENFKKKIMGKFEKDCLLAAHPIPETLRSEVYQHYKLKKLKKAKDNSSSSPPTQGEKPAEETEEEAANMMNLLLLEGLYADLCGPAFRYRMGLLGDQWFDLFFWYVLQDDKDLACVMWEHVQYPVRSAICASYLLRRMAKNKNIDPIDQQKLLDNSIFFSKKAADVQRAAEEDDESREIAAASLDCDLFLWRGISLMDLAVKGDCESFLETESFKRCVHRRLYGDLSPDGNDTWWHQFKLIFSTLTVGLPVLLPPTIFPRVLKWAPPPRSEGMRHSTQRRVIPKGYPHRPFENQILSNLMDEKSKNDRQWNRANNVEDKLAGLLKMRDEEIEKLTSHQLATLWEPTFGWLERWGCFWTSPYVVFLLNCFVTFGVTLFFTVWFVWMRLQPSSFPDMHDNMTGHEVSLNLYFVGCLLREISQFWVSYLKYQGYVEGFFEYFKDVWNVPEVLSLISFFVGFWWRFACIQSGGCKTVFSAKDNSLWFSFSINDSSIETYNLFYALSLFFNWIRVLRCLCLTNLGVTIGIFFSMLQDGLTWLLLYVILLIAISMLFVGTSSVETLVPGYETCSKDTDLSGDDLPENGYIGCSFAYVLIRPMLQSFGEFSLTEMTNFYSFAFLLVTYFFLNLVLINLLIATMSSTYATVSAKAAKWKLIYEYELVQEHARRAIAYPAPFNLVLLIWDLFLFHLPQVQKNLRNNYPDYTRGQRLERFLARNTNIDKDYRVRGATHSTQDLHDATTQAAISAIMGRAQRTVMNKEHSKGSLEDMLEHAKEKLEKKLDSISKDAKCIQGMHIASNRGSTRARMLDKRDFYTNTSNSAHNPQP
jgi:hypothetical protein